MSEIINSLNTKYNNMIEELFEEVLCDKCRKTVKLGNIQGKLVNTLNNETLFLCKECNDKITTQIKKL
jgi:RNase P subunit RPR2